MSWLEMDVETPMSAAAAAAAAVIERAGAATDTEAVPLLASVIRGPAADGDEEHTKQREAAIYALGKVYARRQ